MKKNPESNFPKVNFIDFFLVCISMAWWISVFGIPSLNTNSRYKSEEVAYGIITSSNFDCTADIETWRLFVDLRKRYGRFRESEHEQ